MEKDKIAHLSNFHLFPQCFSKTFFFNVLKRVYMEERVNVAQIMACHQQGKKTVWEKEKMLLSPFSPF